MKIIRVRCKDAEKQTVKKALEIINTSKTQEEAMKRLKERFGNHAKLNAKCYFAFNSLPKAGN